MSAPRPHLLLLHAFGASGRSFAPLVERLQGFAVDTPDLPGFGEAPPLPNPSIAAYVDWIEAAAARLDSGPLLVGGWSMGGKLATAFAARRPSRVAGLLLIAPSPPVPEPMDEDDRRAQLEGYGDGALARRSIESLTSSPLPAALLDEAVEARLKVDPSAWRWWLEAGSRETVETGPGLATPGLLAAGEDDPNLGPAVQRRLTLPVLRDAPLEAISGSGHFIPLEQPAALARIVSRRFAPPAPGQATPAPPVAP